MGRAKETPMENCLDWMGKAKQTPMEKCLDWIQMVCLSPIAFLVFILMALCKLLRFLTKASLLFIIVAINTPFAVMYNLSIMVFQYYLIGYWKSGRSSWNWSDPRTSLGIEVKLFLGDFLKVVAGELLLVIATSIITYFTAPHYVFYITLIVGVIAIFHKWLNSNSLSKTALSCLCDGLGLSPLMFLFSFIGLFNIGCHPVAKCSFAARQAYLFVRGRSNEPDKEEPDLPDEEDEHDQRDEEVSKDEHEYYQTLVIEEDPKVSEIGEDDRKSSKKEGPIEYPDLPHPHFDQPIEMKNDQVVVRIGEGDTKPNDKESPKVVVETFHPSGNQLVEIKDDQIAIVVIEEGDTEPKYSPKQVVGPPRHRILPFRKRPESKDESTNEFVNEGSDLPNQNDDKKPALELSNPPHEVDQIEVVIEESDTKPVVKVDQNLPFEILHPGAHLFLDGETYDKGPPVGMAFFEMLESEDESTNDFIDDGLDSPNNHDGQKLVQKSSNQPREMDQIDVHRKSSDKEITDEVHWYRFKEKKINSKQQFVEFLKWNAFERGLFQFNPRIDFIITHHSKKYRFILKTFMVLKLLGVKLCEYPVDTLELPEDFSKPKQLFNFLVTLSEHDGFVTDKMRGRYEHSLTLLEIAEGVQANEGYKIVHPMDKLFVVAGYTNLQ